LHAFLKEDTSLHEGAIVREYTISISEYPDYKTGFISGFDLEDANTSMMALNNVCIALHRLQDEGRLSLESALTTWKTHMEEHSDGMLLVSILERVFIHKELEKVQGLGTTETTG